MKESALVFLMFISSSFATTQSFDLNINLSLNDKNVSNARLHVKAGESAMITQMNGKELNFIEVLASEGKVQGHQGILLKFAVGILRKGGQKTILSKPEILVKENRPGQFTVGEQNGMEKLSLSVIAKKVL